jgi:hypothetical protein
MPTKVHTETTILTASDALELYRRLRARGQGRTLARLSVEAQCGDLPLPERRRISQLLRESDPASG